LSVGFAFTPGGAMEIIVGMLALEMRLITEVVFVAIVFAAILSSMTVGPLLTWSLRRRAAVDVSRLLVPGAVTLELDSRTRWEAIEELCGKMAASMPTMDGMGRMDKEALVAAVRRREEIMGTGLDHGVAVPHARLAQLDRPLVAFGLSIAGIPWDAPDGEPARFVFLVLTPEQEEGMQVQILASIARAMSDGKLRETLRGAEDEATVFSLLNRTLALGADGAAVID
jgi:mannitol/fructose-specific phosphotransferase system IIA component (Ntr-type)